MCHQFWKDNNFQTLSFPPWIPNISPMGEISPRLRTPGLDNQDNHCSLQIVKFMAEEVLPKTIMRLYATDSATILL